MTKTKDLIRMERHGESGWEFTVINTRYRTDPHGEGLWQYCQTGSWFSDGEPERAWSQTTGLCQFSLPKNRSAAYSKIRRTFRDDIEFYLRHREDRWTD